MKEKIASYSKQLVELIKLKHRSHIKAGKFLVVEGGVLNKWVSMLTDTSNIVEFQQKGT